MLQRLSAPFSRLSHQSVSLILLGCLLFLRIPFITTIATCCEQSQEWAYIVFVIGTYLITAILIWRERERLRDFWIDLTSAIVFLCQIFMFPFGAALFVKMHRSKSRFPPPPPGLLRWVLIGALLAILTTIFTMQFRLYPEQQRSDNPASLTSLFSIVLIQMSNAAVWEEPLFRGFLWGFLRKGGWKNAWIWLFQALLFTFSHAYYLRVEPLPVFFVRMMMPALLMGLMAWKARSITASMVTHGFLNASSDLLMHTRTLVEAMTVAWTAAGVVAAGLGVVLIFEVWQRLHLRDRAAPPTV